MALDGAHVAVTAGMLGHISPTTLNTYAHFVRGLIDPEREPHLPPDYRLDRSDPDVWALR